MENAAPEDEAETETETEANESSANESSEDEVEIVESRRKLSERIAKRRARAEEEKKEDCHLVVEESSAVRPKSARLLARQSDSASPAESTKQVIRKSGRTSQETTIYAEFKAEIIKPNSKSAPKKESAPKKTIQRGRTKTSNKRVLPTRTGEQKDLTASSSKIPRTSSTEKDAKANLKNLPKEKTPSSARSSSNNRRGKYTKPESIAATKDKAVRPKFEGIAKRMSNLQYLTTFQDPKVRAQLPITQHFMMTYDEVVKNPYRPEFSIFKRQKPFMGFLVPEGVDLAVFSDHLMNVAKEMKKTKRRTGECYGLYKDVSSYYQSIFGERETKPN